MAVLLRLSVWTGQSAMHLRIFVFLLFSWHAQGAVFGDGVAEIAPGYHLL